jgi:hypothetical protein
MQRGRVFTRSTPDLQHGLSAGASRQQWQPAVKPGIDCHGEASDAASADRRNAAETARPPAFAPNTTLRIGL